MALHCLSTLGLDVSVLQFHVETRLIIIILCQMMSAILVELVMVEGFVTIPFSMSQEISDPYLCRHRIYYIKLH